MITQLQAEIKCLEYKLNAIRGFCETHLEMNPETIELQGVLNIIEQPVTVDSSFVLERPFVDPKRLEKMKEELK